MPEIVVNARFLSRPITGVERYGREILSFIGSRCRLEKTRFNGFTGHLWEQFVLPAKLTANSVLWSPANTGPLCVRNQALTVHDLSPLEHPEWFRKSFARWYALLLPLLIKRVQVIFTPTDYVRQKIVRRFGTERVTTAPNGVNTLCFHPDAKQYIYQLPERFILFVGSLQPRKNLQALWIAWSEIKNEYQNLWLVIAGRHSSIYAKTELAASERVHFLGYIPEEALAGLYAKATLFVLPSLDEGFGLPALEAMACGTPVIVSSGGALPEVVGSAGLIFDLRQPGSLSPMIRSCLEDHALYSSLVARGLEHVQKFSWKNSAELIWNTLNGL